MILDLQKIEKVIRPLIESSGYSLYDLDFQGRNLRVFIEKEQGIGINDCVEVSRLINPVMDVEDLVPGGRYELEVSSPGLDRELRRPEHFQSALGEVIHVITAEPMSSWNPPENAEDRFFEKRKKFKGELVKFENDEIILIGEGREAKVPLSGITRAYVDFEVIKQGKKSPGKKKDGKNGR